MYKTFNGWKQSGRVVNLGQKGEFRNEYGDAMFHIDQTVRKSQVEIIRVYRDANGRFINKTVRHEYV